MKNSLSRHAAETLVWLSLLWLITSQVIAQAQTLRVEDEVRRRARPFAQMIDAAANRHRVDPHLLYVVGYLETRFRPAAISPRGARGMMQFMPATAARYGLRHPHQPAAALDAAARYLRDLAGRFAGRADLMLAAYNAGEATVDAYLKGRTIKVGKRRINPHGVRTGGIPPYRETRSYVARGVKLLQALRAGSVIFTPTVSMKETPAPLLNKRRSIFFARPPAQE